MPIKLTAADWRAIFPRAPKEIIDAFASKQGVLDAAGITASKTRLAYFLANIEHECSGFTIRNLTESISYTAARMAKVWPNRFKSASAVQARYGAGKGWQTKAFDDIYGNRMGNRPGTSDGSRYIGRGGPQWTGRDGYAALERLTGLPTAAKPELASRLDMQPEICAAFWTWKKLNRFADANDFLGCVKAWNGGTNGLADRKALMAGNDPIIKRLETSHAVAALLPSDETVTQVEPVAIIEESDPTPPPFLIAGDPDVASAQTRLKAMNYSPGLIDGKWGSNTSGAIAAFLNDRDSTIPAPTSRDAFAGSLEDLKEELADAEAEKFVRPVSQARASADAAVVAKVAPEVVPVRTNQKIGIFGGLSALFFGFVDYVKDSIGAAWGFFTDNRDSIDPSWVTTATGYVSSIPPIVWILGVAGLFGWMYLNSRKAVAISTTSVQTGARQ